MNIPAGLVSDAQARFMMFFGAVLLVPIGVLLAAEREARSVGIGAILGCLGLVLLFLWWRLRPEVPRGTATVLQRLGGSLSAGCAALAVLALVLFLRTSPGDPVGELAPSIACGVAALACAGVRVWAGLRLRRLLRRR